MEIYSVEFLLYQNNKLIQQQTMDAPKEVIIMQFISIAKQMRNTSEKIKLKLTMPEIIWIPWDNKRKMLVNCIELQNY